MKQFTIALFIICSTTLSSQIEISVEEYSQIFTIGNTFDFNVDYSHTLWDIGNPGGDNHWDFTAAEPVKETLFSPSMIAADETPFLEIYPTATVIEYSEGDSLLMDSTLVNYKRYSHYGKLSSGLYDELGIGEIITTTNPNGEMLMYTSTESYTHDSVRFQFPLHFGDTWTLTDTFTTAFKWGEEEYSEPRNTHFFDDSLVVDAWGTIKLPNGKETEALRVLHFSSSISPSIFPGLPPTLTESNYYRFYTENDGYLFVDVIDDNNEHAGVVEGDVLWIEQTTISSSTKEWNQTYISELSQNYPNPFRNSTSIDYKLAEHTNVSVEVYDVFGKLVDVLVNQKQAPGLYSFQYDGSKLASGNYFIQLKTSKSEQTIKVSVIK